jgi:L-amino acid N-acyltransferase YncA
MLLLLKLEYVANISQELYNYYVENTIHTNEFDGRTEQQIGIRINDVIQSGLPYLVAISKSNQSKATPGYVTEKIVGYINLEDYCDQSSLWRYTFQMELFVHPGFTSKGIGKCLMDRLLEMVDTSYRARGGYQYVNNFDYLKTGPSRVVKTILLNVHHVNGEDPQNGWEGKFMKDCTFWRVGRLPEVGHKKDKVVDVSIYAHHTKEHINPSVLPTVTG